MMGILEGKSLVITGVLTDQSIAFHVARIAQEQGAQVVLTGFGRGLALTKRISGRLPSPVEVLELDVTNDEQLAGLAQSVGQHCSQVDGVLHSIGFAPESALGGNFLNTDWPDVATAVHVSAYSLKSLTMALKPLMPSGSAVVGLDFDATLAWPAYDWMGVAKAALEATARYLARDLGESGIRVNLVSAGPLRTVAATHIPGFSTFEELWSTRAPLGWDVTDPVPAAQACVALLSPWFPATSGEIVHVDGGFHSQGA
ncbi:MAG: enoyl-[acyl-carrier-protein] reductase FabI [Actinobacteria bacterium]|nr:enoyl-[acyl-carrier-protein] reductase FabI [Actinomycetota bacterium]